MWNTRLNYIGTEFSDTFNNEPLELKIAKFISNRWIKRDKLNWCLYNLILIRKTSSLYTFWIINA